MKVEIAKVILHLWMQQASGRALLCSCFIQLGPQGKWRGKSSFAFGKM